ncbi:chromate transporter [Azohydromonas caseinilytica]|uniref:Chromate transporter n=1 Tax=Azohydromonas caseinilytica TaxID=2728836 RepID=A0A848F7G6_9BURK|nr:chromate transporter [Azohydromonas caseinilytica]NML14499.1 chromate transporter [Azohydromonas caseinilytica]
MSEQPAPAAPHSAWALALAFNRLALQGFGGVLPVAQHELVERRGWLTRAEFLELLALAQVLPGPNIVNLALMFGHRHFGLRGAAAALAGLTLVPTLIVLVMVALYGRFSALAPVAGALRGMAAVAAGLVLAMGLKLLPSLKKSPLGLPLALGAAALSLGLILGLHWPLVAVIASVGVASVLLAWWRLR